MLNQTPHAVLLLDEIEKAHPDLFNILLQVMDHGRLTDSNGKSVDFRNVIGMTTNAGAAEMQNSKLVLPVVRSWKLEQKLIKAFTPEFRNRLDAVIRAPLETDVVRKVVTTVMQSLQLSDRQVDIVLDDSG